MLQIRHLDELRGLVGQTVGASEWLEVSQQRIDQFATATGDHQWIHCDPRRAASESPYGATIAHGFLTLSLCAPLLESLICFPTAKRVINYGLNRVRFPNAVVSGTRIRLVLHLTEVCEVADAIETHYECTIEIEGQAKPACVAKWLLRVYL